jgi:hypothetical protein
MSFLLTMSSPARYEVRDPSRAGTIVRHTASLSDAARKPLQESTSDPRHIMMASSWAFCAIPSFGRTLREPIYPVGGNAGGQSRARHVYDGYCGDVRATVRMWRQQREQRRVAPRGPADPVLF